MREKVIEGFLNRKTYKHSTTSLKQLKKYFKDLEITKKKIKT